MRRRKLFQRSLFWLVSLIYFYWHFSSELFFNPLDFLYAIIFLLLLAPVVVFVNNLLIPRLLPKKQYLLIALLFAAACGVGAIYNAWFFNSVIDILLPEIFFINYHTLWQLCLYYAVYSAIAGLLHLSKGWFENIEAQREIGQLKEVKLKTELDAIRAQLNPHFLFNALNSIYSLLLKNDKATPEALINLSDLLRFSLYKTSDEKIRLEEELDMIKKYIELQSLRFAQKPNIELNYNNANLDFEIPPMLLQPLFENAFKHGDTSSRSFILAEVKANNKQLEFYIDNAKPQVAESKEKSEGGIGLSSIKERLRLIYGKNQFFKIFNSDRFTVKIELNET